MKTLPALVLYFLSGACGLVVEQIFERLVTTVIGTSVEAAAIVLSVYFVALSVGAVLFSSAAKRVPNPLRLYGIAELFAGLCAIAIGLGFSHIQLLSVSILQRAGESALLLPCARTLVAALFIAPPAIAMGMTFPAMIGYAELHTRSSGTAPDAGPGQATTRRFMTGLYASNVAGGVVAALGCPYCIFPYLGMTGAALLVGATQLAIGALALGYAPRIGELIDVRQRLDWRPLRSLFVLAFFSGAITFGWEVLWVQLIGATIGMSVYAFSTMLGVVLLGLFLGGALISLLPARVPSRFVIAAAFMSSALASASLFAAWPDVPDRLAARGRYAFTFEAGEWVRFQQAALMLGLPAIALGRCRLSRAARHEQPLGLVW
jgi:spermidine synthase